MGYRILPNGEVWANGVFCVPKDIMKKIKLLDATKLSVLTLALGCDGEIVPAEIAGALGLDGYEVADALEFWAQQGIFTDGRELEAPVAEAPPVQKPALEKLPMPNLTPRDIVALSRENKDIKELLRGAQEILGSTISGAMQSNLVNMVTYYGLSVPVVLTLLHYYKTERDKGKSITPHKLQLMAREWAEDGVDNLERASAKLQEIEDINEMWSKVISWCELDYRRPTPSQQKMLLRWKADFSDEMISFAINTMKKYNEKEQQSVKEVDNILKDWKRKGCSTPDEVKSYKKPESKGSRGNGKLQGKPSFDIDKIALETLNNDDFDV